jgi:hypothetical protein
MSSPYSHLRSVNSSEGGEGEGASRQQPRQHSDKALPSDRMKVGKQVAVLHAIGRHSGPRRPLDADILSRAVTGIAPSTVILSNRFFEAAGWITSPEKGRYAATDALVEYSRRLAADIPDPAAVLRDPARHSWFWEALEPDLAEGQRLAVNDAIVKLMTAAGANDGHLPNVRNLIAWLEHVGMVTVRDQVMVATNAMSRASSVIPPPDRGSDAAELKQQDLEVDADRNGGGPPTTVVAFSFDLRVTSDDLQRLSAEQIKALFEAVGTVMAIKQKN